MDESGNWPVDGNLAALSVGERWRKRLRVHQASIARPEPTVLQRLAWAVLVLTMVALSLAEFHSLQVGTQNDDATYIVLARSLVESDQYGLINSPGSPATARYPFGYPLLLAPFAVLFPNNLDAMKAPSLIATVINASLLFWGWRWYGRGRSYWWAVGLVGLHILTPMAINHSRWVMSEPIFTMFLLLAILLAERRSQGEALRWWVAQMGVVLLFLAFTRSIGLVLGVGILGYMFVSQGRQFWRDALRVIATMMLTLGVVVSITVISWRDLLPKSYLTEDPSGTLLSGIGIGVTGGQADGIQDERYIVQDGSEQGVGRIDYGSLVQDILIRGTLQHLQFDIRKAVFTPGAGSNEHALAKAVGIPLLPSVVGLAISGLILVGYVRWIRRDGMTVFNVTSLLYLAVVFLWVWRGPRLLYPIQIQLQLGFLLGIEAVLIASVGLLRPSGSLPRTMLFSIVGILIAVSLAKSIAMDDSRRHTGDLRERTEWVRVNTPADAVIMTEAPEIDFLYAGRKTVGYPDWGAASSASAVHNLLEENGVDFVLVAPKIYWDDHEFTPTYSQRTLRMLPVLDSLAAQGELEVVHSPHGLTRVFQIQP